MTTINIGIVAHVDAGKTSLTERILYETNVIKEITELIVVIHKLTQWN